MITRLREKMNSDESGFTLIELLVVIIIIGILAAIAIPIFLNQQKTARDGATTTDVRNIATNVQTLLTSNPDADDFALSGATNGWTLEVEGATVEVSGTNGTVAAVVAGADGGTFNVYAYNEDGSAYTSDEAALHYDSAAGGLQQGAADASGVDSGAWAAAGSAPAGGGDDD